MCYLNTPSHYYEQLIVETTGGLILGERLSCGNFCNYFSFKRNLYGKAPVGELHFRAPEQHEGWNGIRDANELTPLVQKMAYWERIVKRLHSEYQWTPVMVCIFGGAFSLGSANSFVNGPDFIVAEDVVMVTMNYRVGAPGFLSTG